MGRCKFSLMILLFWTAFSPHLIADLYSQDTESKSDKSLIRMCAGYDDNINSFDPLVIYYEENSTYSFDGLYDAYKLFNTDPAVTNFYVFGHDGTKQSICGIPFCTGSSCTLRLGLKTAREGTVIIKITEMTYLYSCLRIRLTDLVTGESMELRLDNEYRVSLTVGDYQDRFILNLYYTVTGTNNTRYSTDQMFSVFFSSGVLKVVINLPESCRGWLTISDIGGRVLFLRQVDAPSLNEFIPSLGDGIYIVTFISGTRIFARKIVMRH